MKKKFLTAGIFTALFVCLTVALKVFDVDAIGPNASTIGLSHFNQSVFSFFGTSRLWDKITDVAIIVAIVGAIALLSYIIYRSLVRKKIDRNLYALGGLYVATGIFYLLFEKILIINYRPIYENGKLAASYPSTHTLLACVLMWSTAILLGKYIKEISTRRILQTICVILSLFIGYGRIFAGMHWMTDVHGAFLLTGALVFTFWGMLSLMERTNKKDDRRR